MPHSDLPAWLIEHIARKPLPWRSRATALAAGRRSSDDPNGPARIVDEASRLQDQTKILATPIVTSATFAAAAGRRLRSLGQHALRGVAEPVEIFAPI